jgi:Zn-dependent protease with chaperone function
MEIESRSKRKNTSKTLDVVVILMFVVLIAVIVVSILGYAYNLNWSGLHGKTFWDWLQLLIIPAVLAVGGYLFNYTTSRNEQKTTQLRGQTERDISSDNQREAALQAYIDNMSELLLDRHLRESGEDDEVRKIARVRTLTVLPRLDGLRKRSVLSFLYESGLIGKGKSIVDLSGAELVRANLSRANLSRADLGGADLGGAKVTDEQLAKAHSLLGAIMPDGKKHD